MKKITIALLGIMLAAPTLANDEKVTFEKGIASAKKNLHGKTITPEETIATWNKYAEIPVTSGAGSGTVEEFTIDSNVDGAKAKRLKPVSTHICTLGQVAGEYHRGLKAVDVRVQKNSSDGYWYLFADGYSSHNYGKAICWSK